MHVCEKKQKTEKKIKYNIKRSGKWFSVDKSASTEANVAAAAPEAAKSIFEQKYLMHSNIFVFNGIIPIHISEPGEAGELVR